MVLAHVCWLVAPGLEPLKWVMLIGALLLLTAFGGYRYKRGVDFAGHPRFTTYSALTVIHCLFGGGLAAAPVMSAEYR